MCRQRPKPKAFLIAAQGQRPGSMGHERNKAVKGRLISFLRHNRHTQLGGWYEAGFQPARSNAPDDPRALALGWYEPGLWPGRQFFPERLRWLISGARF